jgi:hypothetical protein
MRETMNLTISAATVCRPLRSMMPFPFLETRAFCQTSDSRQHYCVNNSTAFWRLESILDNYNVDWVHSDLGTFGTRGGALWHNPTPSVVLAGSSGGAATSASATAWHCCRKILAPARRVQRKYNVPRWAAVRCRFNSSGRPRVVLG